MTEEYKDILDKIFIEIIVELQKTEFNSKLVAMLQNYLTKTVGKKLFFFTK